MARTTTPREKSLTALAASLDTRKRPAPVDTPAIGMALRSSAKAANAPVSPPRPRLSPKNAQRTPAVHGAGGPLAGPRSVAAAALLAPLTRPRDTRPRDARRKFPRADLEVRAHLALADDPTRHFEATLATKNISVGGMFLESQFFLKVGTRLLVVLALPSKGRVIRVKGEVLRAEVRPEGVSGFALRFTEYLDDSHVALATHFLAPLLREFLTGFARDHDYEAGEEYLAHTIDVIAAWELRKAELGDDVWAFGGPP